MEKCFSDNICVFRGFLIRLEPMMKIEHEVKKRKGSFFIEESGEMVARLDYFNSSPGEMKIYHTEVAPSFRGEGIGKDLVAAAVDFARKNSLKIVPTCPYAKDMIDENPELQDVLA